MFACCCPAACADKIDGYRDEARRLRWILADLLEGDAPAGEGAKQSWAGRRAGGQEEGWSGGHGGQEDRGGGGARAGRAGRRGGGGDQQVRRQNILVCLLVLGGRWAGKGGEGGCQPVRG